MSDVIYRRTHNAEEEFDRPLKPGQVVDWTGGERHKAVIFGCPCGEREVYVTSPPHSRIDFDAEGRLTIEASCGYRAKGDRPQNWCHFFMTRGRVEMCGDSQCPGAAK